MKLLLLCLILLQCYLIRGDTLNENTDNLSISNTILPLEYKWTTVAFAIYDDNTMYVYEDEYTDEEYPIHIVAWALEYMEEDYAFIDTTKAFIVTNVDYNS